MSFKRNFNEQEWFYAVGVGRKTGVFQTWTEIAPLVNGLGNAKFKKFKTEEEAENFVQFYASPQKVSTSHYQQSTPPTPPVTPTHRNSASQQPVTPTTPTYNRFASQATVNPVVSNVITKSRQMSMWSCNQAAVSTQPVAQSSVLSQATKQPVFDEEEEDYDEIFNLRSQPETSTARSSHSQPSSSSGAAKQKPSNDDLMQDLDALKFRLESIEESLHDVIGSKTVEIEKLKKDIESLELLIKNNNKPELCQTLARLKERETEREEVKPAKRAKLVDFDENGSSSSSSKKQKNGQLNFSFDGEGYCIVYTDGACTNNGRNGAKAGIGVFFGDNHPLNLAEPLTGDCPATNNNAEIQAASYALNIAKTSGIKKVSLHTDSQFTIDCITKWLPGWKKKGWRKADGNPVQNRDQLEKLEDALEDMEVNWIHVRGHSNIHGNEMADKLANEGAARYGKSSP